MPNYGSSFYGAGFYGGSVLSMSLFDTDWNIAYTTDDASEPTPSWTTLDQGDIRSVDVSRGRDDELGRVEAGTAQLVLNNLTRSFDPQVVTGLRPMNRWRIRAVHASVTYDVFLGYAESYEQSWPGMGFDAVTTVRLVDEFKVLALDKLPTTDPPRDTYQDVVMYDKPAGYWPMDTPSDALQQTAVLGPTLTSVGGASSASTGGGAIVGQEPSANVTLLTGHSYAATLQPGDPGDMGGLADFAWEGHVALNVAAPTADWNIMRGPLSSSNDTWRVSMNTSRQIVGTFRNSGGTTKTVTSTTVWDTSGTWHHVVLTCYGGSLWLWVDGVAEDGEGMSGVMGAMDTDSQLILGTASATGTGQISVDEVAVYRHSLDGAAGLRIPAHYVAATSRGFDRAELPGSRITSVLAASTSVAASSVRTGSRGMTGSYMKGQAPLDELRQAEDADSVDSILFVAKDGTVTFLDDGHRSVSPWNAVQATFDDDGTDLGYRDLTYDYSETFLYNDINVTRTGGVTATVADTTSVSRYRTRSLALSDLPIWDDADASAIATALLAKYKDPMTRITSIGVFLYDTGTISEVLTLELADRIRILRTHPAGGARIDQTAFVQKIQLSSRPGQPITVTLGVSPL
jgi:hypothetical protein